MNPALNGRRESDPKTNLFIQFATSGPSLVGDLPLRVKKELAPRMLAISEWKEVPTEELIEMARKRGIHTTDRASAIAVLEGLRRRR